VGGAYQVPVGEVIGRGLVVRVGGVRRGVMGEGESGLAGEVMLLLRQLLPVGGV